MLNKHAIAVGLALAVALPAHAEFRWELGASYLSGDVDDDFIDADVDIAGVDGSQFFSPVSTEKGPLSEAAFLDRASHGWTCWPVTVKLTTAGDVDITSYGVGSRWVINKDAGWLIEGAVSRDEFENFEVDNFTIGGGKYLLENTLVRLSYTYTDPDLGDDIDAYTIEAEHIAAAADGRGQSRGGLYLC